MKSFITCANKSTFDHKCQAVILGLKTLQIKNAIILITTAQRSKLRNFPSLSKTKGSLMDSRGTGFEFSTADLQWQIKKKNKKSVPLSIKMFGKSGV